MHIIHYVPDFGNPAGGREFFVHGLVQHLQNYGVQQSVITNSKNSKFTVTKSDNVAVFSLPVKKMGAYMIMKNLFRLLQQTKCDIINIHGYGEYAGDIACIMKITRILKVPLVLNTHGSGGLKHAYLALDFSSPFSRILASSYSRKERIARLMHIGYDFTVGRLEMRTFDRIIALSDEEKQYLSKIGLKDKKYIKLDIAINDIFLNYNSNCGSSNSSSRNNCILYVGRIDQWKGIHILLESVKQLKLWNMKLNCIIIGKDCNNYRSYIEMLIEKLEISDVVEIKEFVSQEDLLEIYSSALTTVLPSFSEGFPLSLVESMALGTPFVAHPVGAITELVNLSKAGLLVPIGDPVSLAQQIRNLIEDPKLWSELSNNGRRYAKNFAWSKITKLYYDLYSELVH